MDSFVVMFNTPVSGVVSGGTSAGLLVMAEICEIQLSVMSIGFVHFSIDQPVCRFTFCHWVSSWVRISSSLCTTNHHLSLLLLVVLDFRLSFILEASMLVSRTNVLVIDLLAADLKVPQIRLAPSTTTLFLFPFDTFNSVSFGSIGFGGIFLLGLKNVIMHFVVD